MKIRRIQIFYITGEITQFDTPYEYGFLPTGLLITPKDGTTHFYPYTAIKKIDFGVRLQVGGTPPGKIAVPGQNVLINKHPKR